MSDDAKPVCSHVTLKRQNVGNHHWYVCINCPQKFKVTEWNEKVVVYKKYQRTQIVEMADWEEGFNMDGISISIPDVANGSPKLGDKIARNPANHDDKWLVSKEYFEANFEEIK